MQAKLLRINLTNQTAKIEDIPEDYLRDYLGGAGLAARYLWDEIPAGTDPMSPENKIMFSTGPLNGGSFPTSGRYNVSCLSPLTGIWLDASSSGRYGYYMRRAGLMAIIVEGKAEKPVYVVVNNDQVEFKDAANAWGQTTIAAIKTMQEESGLPKSSVALIGPAGEKQMKLACVMNDDDRAAGRGGAGAVMGAKNLKGILVTGDQAVDFAKADAWKEIVKDFVGKIKENPLTPALHGHGTAVGMAMATQTGDAPTKNWTMGGWDGYMAISGPAMTQTILRKHPPACYACPIQCGRFVEIEEGPYKMKGGGPEYETLGSFGSNCLNDNLASIAFANEVCNEYGVDVISTGSMISWAMECYDKGIITKEDTDGIELTWGNHEAIIALLYKIVNQEGIGKVLGQGARRAAEIIGKGSDAFTVHVKGLEAPMHDPRAFFGFGPTYATSPRGACHCHGYVGGWDGRRGMPEAGVPDEYAQDPHGLSGKGILSKAVQDYCTAIHSSIICLFTTYALGPTELAQALSAATGFDYTAQDVLKIGERVFNLQRAFNNRFGITRADDNLPVRLMTPIVGGPAEGFVPNLEEQLAEYYEARGWEADGRPSQAKLRELGLEFVIGELYA